MSGLPNDWTIAPLVDVAEILDSRRIPVNASERAKRIGDVPYYGATGQVGTIDQALFDEDLVLLGEDGAPFFDPAKPKAYRIAGPAWVNNHAHVLRVREVVDWRFLEHFLNRFDYRGYVNGSTRLKLTQGSMQRIPVAYPPIAEQRRIVEILEDHLSRLDAAETLVSDARKRVEAMVASAEDRVVWGAEHATASVSELLRERMRNGHSARAARDGESGIRTLTLTAVTLGRFRDEHTKITVADADRVGDLWLKPGDILVQRANTPALVGATALYEGPADWAIFPDLLIRLRVDESRVRPNYLALALSAERTHRSLRSRAKGLAGSMPKVDQTTIGETRVPLPTLDQQDSILKEMDSIRHGALMLEGELSRTIRRAVRLRSSLLTAAFSGKLTGSSSDPERIEELVEAGV